MLSNILIRSRLPSKCALRNLSSLYIRRANSHSLALSKSVSRNKRGNYGLTLIGLAAAWAAINQTIPTENDADVNDDAENTVVVDRSVSPFPIHLAPPQYPLSTSYSLLGYGFRYVTFVSFRVYALGIYIADQDRHLVHDVLSTKFLSTVFIDTDQAKSHKENVADAMKNPEKSAVLIGNLLDAGCRMLAKITPVRNTDFNHLKDGLVRTILNHPDAKNNYELLNPGLEQLKNAFTRKGKVPKDHDLMLELQANGSLQLSYYDRGNDEMVILGQVNEPLVGKFLFSQYMSGPKPLSPSTQQSVAEHIVSLV
ncbi:AIM46 (YHR199C) [Zygosaccharomyces parabailii]|uniref:Altered inheritance of mitochondria protein 18, mitochondrial n=1 Tax=Zygosaccharomyces bailii (strain CLIB 213 / ATCC 58445 / CBS 680 / BCRC 21525 / NBRC 1098 / NCYC 1416 / NRRL Y-2227) TaxID=1333698 RepID=A0A8J2XA31_ZYGB2|nr:AIM46 (YHR199C) [Zygosaccharomyces parabailii]CDF91300.1 ZYBA0S10-04214g1_1 [Zygosaccharomyces bailii CLIB 213]CDH17070.1 probable Altered inheritance of mitochondria protein 18, mitochondrial [Zygosaccharomyces bailii ISA1307]SJM88330.1 probable Altered inheritance of mitochondria protein 18, mitochondrial [Zygosaccharomyces bailii]